MHFDLCSTEESLRIIYLIDEYKYRLRKCINNVTHIFLFSGGINLQKSLINDESGLLMAKIILVIFYPFNACTNPLLYAIITKQFRKDMKVSLIMCYSRSVALKFYNHGTVSILWIAQHWSHAKILEARVFVVLLFSSLGFFTFQSKPTPGLNFEISFYGYLWFVQTHTT